MIKSEWQPIENAPLHTDILFYRDDAGVFYGQKTSCRDWVSEEEQDEHNYSDETLDKIDCWSFGHYGCERLENDLKPTHWMPLPEAPK